MVERAIRGRGPGPLRALVFAGCVRFVGESRVLLSGCAAGFRQTTFLAAAMLSRRTKVHLLLMQG